MTFSPATTMSRKIRREPLGRIFFVCGPDCSDTLLGQHLTAVLAAGNSVTLAFVGVPPRSLRRLVSLISSLVPPTRFRVMADTSGSWDLVPDHYVLVVLTAKHIVVADDRQRHQQSATDFDSSSLRALYSSANQKVAVS
jgi:hypothetical protein